ncbi:MAG: protein-export membrane protein SecF [Candidatus Buchananbacteria bacterium RIFCSPHIGHO2_02_FULL_56_16]|uniref:Protein-export membrane protein SecF n=1 Tax=Candidatus Buchananbacteria bacterium RIFCSPHIGHO2_02_FULL_56_16 TaxID=1797542 RepID=A0A1G1YHH7_9BACT|nr:MAG: protein-export membrane protein SecF [Candidatus Buchananbacteria bacterium RIFCSPHIGHO2_02_FULL_56_16]
MLQIIKQRNIWFPLSGLLVAASLIMFAVWGLRLGIDFTGGSLLELEFSIPRPNHDQIVESFGQLNLGEVTVQPIGEQNVILRFADVDEATHQQIVGSLRATFAGQAAEPGGVTFEERRFDSIGPIIGQELRTKTVRAIGLVLIAIIAYVGWAFRKVSKPVPSWQYGLIAVIALFHDIMITIGTFAVLGQAYGIEVNASFVAALLTILGYSVNDTIVVFDRIRENLVRRVGEGFDDIIQFSLNQVITRSVNTSLTVILVLFAILLLGGSTLRIFALSLIVGVSVGTYSSIFLASPLLVVAQKLQGKR